MCILMVAHKKVQDYPIVLAANRDEYRDRPTEGPGQLCQVPVVWGGRDMRAGGTWLGVNAHGLVVGLTNRRMHAEQENDPTRRSRGLLCLDVLQCASAAEAIALLDREPPERYNPFNLFVVDLQEAYWSAYEKTVQTRRLPPGLYILANRDMNDFETVRIRRARDLLEHTEYADLQTLIPLLERVCQDHEVGVQERETICMHRSKENYGTVSSTILALTPEPQGNIYRYAAGSPCTTSYKDYSYLLSALP